METPVLRTLHSNPAASDLVSAEQRLAWIEAQLRAAKRENAGLSEQLAQVVRENTVLAERVRRLETAVLALPKQPSPQEAAAPPAAQPAAAPSAQRRRPVLASFDQKNGVFGNQALDRGQISSVTFLSS